MKLENIEAASIAAKSRQALLDELSIVEAAEFIDLKITPKPIEWRVWERKVIDLGDDDKRATILFHALREVAILHLQADVTVLEKKLRELGVEP